MSDLLTWIALRRVHSGHVAKCGGCWIDAGRPVPGYLPAILDGLIEDGLIVLADDGPHGPLRRASPTDAGQTRYAALREHHGARDVRAGSEVPAPDVRVCGLSFTEPPTASTTGPRWARDQYDRRLHALEGVDVLLAEARGYAECLCGYQLPAEVVFEDGPSGALCLLCVVGAVADVPDPGNRGSPL